MAPSVAVAAFCVLCVRGVLGHSYFQNEIPNGANVMRNGESWPGVGHDAKGGFGARNTFGTAFETAGSTWTKTLCEADSDGDGQTNGHELGDPKCVWKKGDTPQRPTDVSHPGFVDSKTAASVDDVTATTEPTSQPTAEPSAGLAAASRMPCFLPLWAALALPAAAFAWSAA
eukprot:TRINITY_DN64488_c0_g1_i1.p1 TRINITY_DN64488_c0_g1~~TRINITY_DN64488_c0_g1_i1.p1  ORF type:complete len:189 (-),score=38.24 TRINITY_DN64488_c0_g1_i1:66-581(-)